MNDDKKVSRRRFVQTVIGGAAVAGIASALKPLGSIAQASPAAKGTQMARKSPKSGKSSSSNGNGARNRFEKRSP